MYLQQIDLHKATDMMWAEVVKLNSTLNMELSGA